MPEMTPVGNTGVSGLDMYAKILGIRQAQQNLQTGKAVQQSEIAQAKVAQQTALENQNIASLMSDPVGNGITDNDGKPTEGAYKKVLSAAPNSGAERYEKIVSAATAKVGFNNALNNLNAQERADITGPMSLVATNLNSKSQDILDAVDNVVSSKKGTPLEGDYSRVATFYKGLIDHAKESVKGTLEVPGQEKWRMIAQGLNRQILPPEAISGAAGLVTPQAGSVNNGAVQSQGVVAPAIAGGGFTPATQVQNQLAPSDRLGYVQGKAGVQGQVEADNSRFSSLMNSASQAQSGIALADQVGALAKQVRTGKLTKDWADRLSVLQQENPQITARQMLGKYASQLQTLAMGSAASDNDRAQIKSGMPDPDSMDPKAVGQAANYLHGYFRMAQDRGRNAYEHVTKNGTPGLTMSDTQYSSSRDPFVYSFKDMPRDQQKEFLLERFGPGHSKALDEFEARVNQK